MDNPEIQELLIKVLDMTEDEQRVEIAKYLPNEKRTWSHLTRSQDHVGDMWICFKCGKRWNSYSARLQDKKCSIPSPYKGSLADLAFRLRGEVKKIIYWWDACQSVYEHVSKEEFDKSKGWKSETGIWFQDFAKPIHWIIAALIAKELIDGTEAIPV